MLPKNKRLNLKKDFKWVVSGQKVESKFVTLFMRTGQNSFPLVGIASSSRHFKKATDRNRAKRVTSSVIEKLYSKLPSNINIVVLPKLTIVGVKSQDVLSSMEEVLNL